MKSKDLLDNAVDYIYEVVYGQDWICEALLIYIARYIINW